MMLTATCFLASSALGLAGSFALRWAFVHAGPLTRLQLALPDASVRHLRGRKLVPERTH